MPRKLTRSDDGGTADAAAEAAADAAADAVVVGAGPAGATTALLLARAGHDVVLLDRASFPRAKPCGDCLSAGATRVLDRLGVLDAVLDRAPARLEGWTIVAPDGSAFDGRFHAAPPPHTQPHRGGAADLVRGRYALSIPRHRLDPVLVDAARDAGARVRTGVRVTNLLRDRRGRTSGVRGRGPTSRPVRLRARLVVGADGLRSIVARRLGLVRRRPRLRKLSLTAHVRGIAGVSAQGEMHVGRGAVAGLAPVDHRHDTCNLTLVVDADRAPRGLGRDAEGFFRRRLADFPALRDRLREVRPAAPAAHRSGAAPTGAASEHALLASGPFDWPTRDVVADGAALVGDAAGYYDPFTGQGIFRALRGAELLAATAHAALRTGDVSRARLRPYARRRTALLRGTRALQRVIELVTARPALMRAAARHLRRSPAAADALVAAIGDLLPARTLLSPRLFLTFLTDQLAPEDRP